MSQNPILKKIGKLLVILGVILFAVGVVLFAGFAGFLGLELWLFSLNYFDLMGPLFFVGFAFIAIGTNFSRILNSHLP